VAWARAWCFEHRVILLDEPLGALDKLRDAVANRAQGAALNVCPNAGGDLPRRKARTRSG